MRTVKIALPEHNDSFSRIVIKNVQYSIRFTYNDTFDYWTFGIYTPLREPIAEGIKIVPNSPLNAFERRPEMPKVVFGCESKLDRIGRYDFKNGDAEFYYIEED